jgi:ferric-dicitrate binding protein FerR (iron transport regulator)
VNPSKDQLIAYFSGALSPEKKRQVEDWLSDSPDDQLVDECIRIALEDKTVVDPDNTADPINAAVPERTLQSYARFLEMTEGHRPGTEDQLLKTNDLRHHVPSGASERTRWQRSLFYKYGMAAAAILIFLVIGVEWYRHLLPVQEQRSLSALPEQKVYHAAKAAITRITLGDGSEVRLFPGSVLTLNDDFNIRDRIVDLKGRGFFEVAHNAALPFYVRSGPVTTRVLGTAFDVNTDQKNDTRIVVKEGKVQVTGTDSVLSDLTPGQGISVNKVSGRWSVQQVDADEYCNWTKGELGFRQAPLREILPTLELWFNVSFKVQRPDILDKKLTFFIRRQNAQEAMEVLSATGGFHYRLQSDTIIIK